MVYSNFFCNFAAKCVKMKNNIPKYLTEKRNVISHVLGTALLAEMIILIFKPFESGKWVPEGVAGDFLYLGFATLAVLVAMGVIAISRTIMYKYAKKHDISYLGYGAWIMVEVMTMSIVYAAFPLVAQIKTTYGFFDLLKESTLYTFFILLIPYAIFFLWFSLKDKNIELQKLRFQVSPKDADADKSALLNFYDEKGDLCLSVRQENLYFIESADNYININYMNGGKLQHFMIRNTLKSIEENFKDKNLIRCHRSYIVNFATVKVLRKAEDGLVLDFDDEKVKNIPVSRGYCDRVTERFTQLAGT